MRSSKFWIGAATTAALLCLSSAALALDEGARAPALRGRSLNGGPAVDLGAARGQVAIVDFWASWCEPCQEAMPAMDRLYRRYRERGLVVIGVSVDQDESNARGFLERVRVSFPVMHDANHSAANRFRPPTMPSTYVIDRNGVVRHVHAGFRRGDAAALEREVRELL